MALLPNLDIMCALTGHDHPYFFRTQHSKNVLKTPLSATFMDLRDDIRIEHDLYCHCGKQISDIVWKTDYRMNEDTDDMLANFVKHRPDASKRLPLHDPIVIHFPGPSLSRGGNNVRLTFEVEEDEDIEPSEGLVDPVSPKETHSDDTHGVVMSSHSRASKRYTDLGDSVFKIGFSDVKLPRPRLKDFRELVSTRGVLYVDKTHSLPFLAWGHSHQRIPIVRRPRGFGKTTFLSMFAYFHDCHSAHEFEDLFGPLSAGRRVLSSDYVGLVRANLDLVLTLDLGLLPVLTIDNMETELTRFLHTTLVSFTDKYRAELNGRTHKCMPFFDPGYCLQDVVHFAYRAGQTVCLCIDNYTAPLLALPETQRTEIAEALELSLFHTIGPCVIKGYIRKGFIVGEWDVPCEPDEWAASESRGPYMDTDHGLFHVCVDLTHFPLMQEAFGFVDSEVRKMDEAVGRLPNVDAAGDILNYLNDPQYFARRFLYMGETERRDVYCTDEVLETLAHRSGRIRF
ncbi:hypothetical protein EV421DRAFT_180586 [Armillaria borealis]|uniref:AAA-ATPase-like domain-containing protein n=1 Tax=Armillaria borealis TaxID=47425 RepID=A0AA39MUV4_9AGAR|nr:hypothetical protein EV421DRAFT_180586 [Armillaria borealis]